MRLIHTVSQALKKVCKLFTSILRFVGSVGKGCDKVADTLEEMERKEPQDGDSKDRRSGTSNQIHRYEGVRGDMADRYVDKLRRITTCIDGRQSCREDLEISRIRSSTRHIENADGAAHEEALPNVSDAGGESK